MTEPFLGAHRAPSAASGTIVSLSSDALRTNLRVAHDTTRAAASDPLVADAWGHGAGWVGSLLAGAGVDHDRALTWSGDDLYGLPGGAEGTVPVMRLAGRVLSTKELPAGEGVSYGYLFHAPADTRVALVTGGYAQGVVRALGGRVDVTLDGVRCPIVGRVAMDVCVVDIGDREVARGAEAVFFGDPGRGEPSLGEWVTATAFSAAELVGSVGLKGRRVHA